MSLAVYTDPGLLAPGEPHLIALAPLWGPPDPLPWPYSDYLDELIAAKPFTAAPLEEADIAVFPRDWKHARTSEEGVRSAESFIADARAAGVTPVFFWASDNTTAFPLRGAVVFRPSLFRSRRKPWEFALPGFHEDLLRHVGDLPVRRWQRRPTVSFCGHAVEEPQPHGLAGRARHALGDVRRALGVRLGIPLRADIYVRWKALERLAAQSDVVTSFVFRDEYGGTAALHPVFRPELWARMRADYVANMRDSDYVLCTRGGGNYSYRLCETLCLGRIPVFVDTDCVLPYESAIDWPSYGIWLDRRDLPHIAEKIVAFHTRLTRDAFVELQQRCRALWEEYLSPRGYFIHLHEHFSAMEPERARRRSGRVSTPAPMPDDPRGIAQDR